ncbi:CotH kinase family protein [candidate division KSB1 bacterium]|nr:CotH kinase family protein [candidate division KSB1 bacterium]
MRCTIYRAIFCLTTFFLLTTGISNAQSSAEGALSAPWVVYPPTTVNNRVFCNSNHVTINAHVSLTPDEISGVEFFASGKKIGEDSESPYSADWNDVSTRSYSLTVKATAQNGLTATSAPVEIKVIPDRKSGKTIPPLISVTHGFFAEPFDADIVTETAGAVIEYTLDGSDPRHSVTAINGVSHLKVTIDPSSTENRARTPAVILRAAAIQPGCNVSDVITKTYIFVESMKEQGNPGGDWPRSKINGQTFDYHVDRDVIRDPRYTDLIDDALLAIPSISIVTDMKYLVSPDSGIYVNAGEDGREWERPASIELINPDGTEGFQIDAGLRIRGGASRSGSNPKHAFRLFFRNEYGNGKLEYPLFGDEGVKSFDKIDLRTSQNYSWSFPGHQGEYNIMNRDVFSRDLQREMGQPYTRSRYYQLYLNGMYWGLFQTQERPEARFASSYFGGNVEDYDIVKTDGWRMAATDGNMDEYRLLWNYTQAGYAQNKNYFEIQGKNPDGSRNPEYKVLVDIDNLIDYMLIIFYTGNFDSPMTMWSGNKNPNNLYCIFNRNGDRGFMFFAHDAEHSLRTTPGEHWETVGTYENRVNLGRISGDYRMVVSDFGNFHAQWLHFKLSDNAEYRLRFADHVYRHFFNHGVVTPEKATALFMSRAKEIEMAIIAESARWGDTYHNPPRTRDDDWLPAINDIVNNYFPVRTGIVLNQLKEEGLYPAIDAPVFKHGDIEILDEKQEIISNFMLTIANPNTNGFILYTTNGTDPRLLGGYISINATNGKDRAEIKVSTSTVIKARVRHQDTWSALHEIKLIAHENLDDLGISELHYHPLDEDTIDDQEFEFIELHNFGTSSLDLSNVTFSEGINYTFPIGTLFGPGEFIVLASNATQFTNRYGFASFAEYQGHLDNAGEKVELQSGAGETLLSFTYDDHSPWPESTDGDGYSLVTTAASTAVNLSDPNNWCQSAHINGSPGADDSFVDVQNSNLSMPPAIRLLQNFPNPFNPTTVISYQLSAASDVNLSIFNINGQLVRTLVRVKQSAGKYKAQWDGLNNVGRFVSSGIYLYRLRVGEHVQTRRMLLIR